MLGIGVLIAAGAAGGFVAGFLTASRYDAYYPADPAPPDPIIHYYRRAPEEVAKVFRDCGLERVGDKWQPVRR